MNITLSVEEETLRSARKRAEAMGTSVNQLVRDYLAELGGGANTDHLWDEFGRLMEESSGDSQGWKFDRGRALREAVMRPVFFDTNVLVYAAGRRDVREQRGRGKLWTSSDAAGGWLFPRRYCRSISPS